MLCRWCSHRDLCIYGTLGWSRGGGTWHARPVVSSAHICCCRACGLPWLFVGPVGGLRWACLCLGWVASANAFCCHRPAGACALPNLGFCGSASCPWPRKRTTVEPCCRSVAMPTVVAMCTSAGSPVCQSVAGDSWGLATLPIVKAYPVTIVTFSWCCSLCSSSS